MPLIRLSRDQTASAFDPGLAPRVRVASGALLEIETHDARAGALLDEPSGRSFVLGPPQRTPNPLTGPIAIEGAEPGDALRVQIESVELGARGWNGAHAHVGGYTPGTIPQALARVCDVEGDVLRFSDTIAPAAGSDGRLHRHGARGGALDPVGGELRRQHGSPRDRAGSRRPPAGARPGRAALHRRCARAAGRRRAVGPRARDPRRRARARRAAQAARAHLALGGGRRPGHRVRRGADVRGGTQRGGRCHARAPSGRSSGWRPPRRWD